MKRFLIVVAFLLLTPVIPSKLSPDVWAEPDFGAVKTEVGKVEGRLERLYFTLQGKRKEAIPSYQLIGCYGTMKRVHPLLNVWNIGSSSSSTWAFPVPVLPDMPHVLIDHAEKTARITPGEFQAFLSWAQTAEVDPATMTYTSH